MADKYNVVIEVVDTKEYLEAEKLDLQKYSLTEIKEQFMDYENKIEPKRPVQTHHQKMKSPKL